MPLVPILALHEDGDFSEYSATSQFNGTIVVPQSNPVGPYEGGRLAQAQVTGPDGYARAQVNVDWEEGLDVWYGGAFYFPPGFKSLMQNQIALILWDYFPNTQDPQFTGGLVASSVDKRIHLARGVNGGYDALLGTGISFDEGRWYWFDVRQKFNDTDGLAINEVYVDGVLIGSTQFKNSHHSTVGANISRISYGIVTTSAQQTNTIALYMDRCYIAASKLGPVTPPSPGTATRVEISEVIQGPDGRVVAGAEIIVKKRNSNEQATVYAGETGTAEIAQPLVSDGLGRIEGWVEGGSYDLHVSSPVASYLQRFEAVRGDAPIPPGTITAAMLAGDAASRIASPGDIKMSARAEPEPGWLLCDGQAVSRDTYSRLFAAIGTSYGAGDGSTTFNLPDLRGRVAVGKGLHADVDALGESEGEANPAVRRVRHRHTTTITAELRSGGTLGTNNTSDRAARMHGGTVGGTFSFGISAAVGPDGAPLDGPAYQVFNFFIKT